jgi:hypothetical protein
MSEATRLRFAAGWLLLLVLAAQSYAAQPTGPTNVAGAAEPSQSVAVSIDTLRNEIAELRRRVEKPPKDVWDKVSSLSGFASGLAVALIGFYATNIYTRQQKIAEERRRDEALNLEKARFESQKGIEKMKFDYERQRWREELASQVALKHVETRLTEYSPLWTRIEVIAKHRMDSGELTQAVARELANHVKNWRYSTGGLLAEPTTRDAAYAFQQAAWAYDGTKESYRRIRTARRILRDALRADMGVSEDVFGKNIIDVAAQRQRIKSNLADLQSQLRISPDADR